MRREEGRNRLGKAKNPKDEQSEIRINAIWNTNY